MTETLTVTARMVVAPGKADLAAKEMMVLVEDTRKEPGCLRYDLHQGSDNPDVFVFIEEWESRSLWEAHMQGAAIRAFNGRIGSGLFLQGEVHALKQIA